MLGTDEIKQRPGQRRTRRQLRRVAGGSAHGNGCRRWQKKGAMADINVTPLIDVVLVLLIIFMVLVPSMLKHMTANVPRKAPPDAPPPDPSATPIVVEYTAKREITVNTEAVAWEALADKIAERLKFVQPEGRLLQGRGRRHVRRGRQADGHRPRRRRQDPGHRHLRPAVARRPGDRPRPAPPPVPRLRGRSDGARPRLSLTRLARPVGLTAPPDRLYSTGSACCSRETGGGQPMPDPEHRW